MVAKTKVILYTGLCSAHASLPERYNELVLTARAQHYFHGAVLLLMCGIVFSKYG